MSDPSFYNPAYTPEDPTCTVYRSDVDARVWLCNIPLTDIATGIQASTSLRTIKAYVEENTDPGDWVRIADDHWQYRIKDDEDDPAETVGPGS